MSVSPRLLYILSFIIVANLIMLALLTTFMNTRRKWSDRRSAKLVAAVRPQFLAALDGGPSPQVGSRRRDRRTFIALATTLLPTIRGSERVRLAELLEESGLVDTALLDLHSRSAVRRARAAELLGRAAVTSSVPELISLLSDRDGDVRRTAARALGLIGDARAVPALLQSIDKRSVPLNTTTMALVRMGRDARGPLLHWMQYGSDQVRAVCAELLGLLVAIPAAPALATAACSDPALEVRIRACRALGSIGAPGSLDALTNAVRQDQPAALRAVATRAIGRLGGPRSISLLRDALHAPEHIVASNAARALATLGDDGERVLTKAAHDGAEPTARYAREGLSQIELQRTERRSA
jgi:HEAT repeat protein